MKSFSSIALLPWFLFALLSSGCQQKSTSAIHADTIATVDGTPISRSELEAEITRARAGGVTNLESIIDRWIHRERLLARARRLGLEQDAEVRHSMENLLIAKLKERELEPLLRSALPQADSNDLGDVPAAHSEPVRQARLAVIRMDVSPKASLAKLKSARERLHEARAKALALPSGVFGFGTIAAEYSDDNSTRLRGGDLGWLDESPEKYHLDPAVLAAGFALQAPGETTPVVAGKDGLYLVRLIERRDRDPFQSNRVETLALHRRQLEIRKSIEEAFNEQTRRTIPVTVDVSKIHQLAAFLGASESDEVPHSMAVRHDHRNGVGRNSAQPLGH